MFLGRTTLLNISKKSAAAIPDKIVTAVKEFFYSDQAIRICPGKSDYVTFKKEKKNKNCC